MKFYTSLTAFIIYCHFAASAFAVDAVVPHQEEHAERLDKKLSISRQDEFLNYVQALADLGELTDPKAVERALDTHFSVSHATFTKDDGHCETLPKHPNDNRTFEVDSYDPDKSIWFSGEYSKGQALNDKEVFKKYLEGPYLTYGVSRTTSCSQPNNAISNVTAEIKFTNVPKFSCITKDQLAAKFPVGQPSISTFSSSGGALIYGFRKETSEDTGLGLSFYFQQATQQNTCMTWMTINQRTNYGKRYSRVAKEFQDCMNRQHIDYDKQRPTPQMTYYDYASQRCGGSIQNLLHKEYPNEH